MTDKMPTSRAETEMANGDMRRRSGFNPKRSIAELADTEGPVKLSARISYGGNPEHKRNRGDFGLSPAASPRPDKTLCDGAKILVKAAATELLKKGAAVGLMSKQMRGEFPQNIRAVTGEGTPMEAQLENNSKGVYHGYPMPETDPFRDEVLRCWRMRSNGRTRY